MNPDFDSSWQFFLQVMNTLHILFDDVEPELAKIDLEPKGFFLLGLLEENPYPAQLAKALCLPNPTVTFLLKRLEKREYVKRASEPGDLRKFRFTLTAAGRKALAKGQTIVGKSFDRMLSQLSASDRKTLFKLFSSLN
jgi:DNA-binding MarR family transcriptional regulator